MTSFTNTRPLDPYLNSAFHGHNGRQLGGWEGVLAVVAGAEHGFRGLFTFHILRGHLWTEGVRVVER